MELLIAILIQLGFFYSSDEINELRETGQAQEISYAQQIIDEGRYYYDDDGVVVIEDDVDPNN